MVVERLFDLRDEAIGVIERGQLLGGVFVVAGLAQFGQQRPVKTYSHRCRLHSALCELCRSNERFEYADRSLSEWAHLDVTIK
ncbi:hypothetical protein [Amycolatopsis sp. cmx-4-68]|uniref:hypothetical protein n=1 Tax=Amycolatopsis sp. cmx-4-68 TaxID=2790938 RepID=UPI003978EDAA